MQYKNWQMPQMENILSVCLVQYVIFFYHTTRMMVNTSSNIPFEF